MRLAPVSVFMTALCALALSPLVRAAKPATAPVTVDEMVPEEHVDFSALDPKVDPCVDFYQYACAVWDKKNPIPADRGEYSSSSKLQLRINQALKELLAKAAVASSERSVAEREVGDVYAACMDEPSLETKSMATLKATLAKVDAMTDSSQLPTVLADMHKDGASALFGFGASPDLNDASIVVLAVSQSGLGLPDRDYYFRTDAPTVKIRNAYKTYMAKVLGFTGTAPAAQKKLVAQVMSVETALAHASLDVVALRDPQKLNHPMSLDALGKLSPRFSWTTYLGALNAPSPHHYLVSEPDFVKAVDAFAGRPLGEIKAYLRWHVLDDSATFLPQRFVDAHFAFAKLLDGSKQLPPRWKRCLEEVNTSLPEALGQAFVDHYFSAQARASTQQLLTDLHNGMEKDIGSLAWMSAATRKEALQKLHSILDKVGAPAKPRDYSSIALTRDNYLANASAAALFELKRQLAKVGKPVDRNEWDMSASTVNAYYEPQTNTINFPAAILQPPFFDEKADYAVNIGATGAAVGHEMTHGFDDEGRQFDAKGNLRDWWTAQDAAQFDKRAQCVVDQYAKFVVDGDVHVNGKLTLGENLADIGGLRITYLALETHLAKNPSEKKSVDGFSPEQRMFIAYAQNWCGNQSAESLREQTSTDPHSPYSFRVNGVVADLPEFGAAFQCKVGSPMRPTPANVCSVW